MPGVREGGENEKRNDRKGDGITSRPKAPYWGFVRNVIRKYPEYAKALAELHAQSVTAAYGDAAPGGSEARRTVELLALRTLPGRDQQYYEAVASAIESTIHASHSGRYRVELIRLMFWERFTMQGAADRLHIGYGTAKRWSNQFIHEVAKNLDLE